MNRSVFHIRVKDIELQAERLADTRLQTCAVAIISSHQQNGTIRCLSKEARKEGLQVGMNVSLVRKMNQGVLLLPYNHNLYSDMHNHITKRLKHFSPIIEPASFGQYYADMTGMEQIFSSKKNAGFKILKDINNQAQLKSLVGISANKLVSSVSTQVVPEPLFEIASGNESRFMAPLSSSLLPSVLVPQVKKQIEFLLLKQVTDIQHLTRDQQVAATLFGKFCNQLSQEAHGKDFAAVCPPRDIPSISVQEILESDTNDSNILISKVRNLAEQIGFKLRQKKKVARSMIVEVHYSDGFKNMCKGSALQNDDQHLAQLCEELFDKANYRRNRIRIILMTASKLKPAVRQLDLFNDYNQILQQNTLTNALDKIRHKFGEASIKFAAAI